MAVLANSEVLTRLVAAAKRGVAVRVLVDWIGCLGTPRSFFKAMVREGVEVRLFSPPGFRPWFGLVPRDHRKLVVVDECAGVTGGIGIGREWKTGVLKRRRAPWRDTAVFIAGDAVGGRAELDPPASEVEHRPRRRPNQSPVPVR